MQLCITDQSAKELFLGPESVSDHNKIIAACRSATVQRGNIYAQNSNDDKDSLWTTCSAYVESILPAYKNSVSEQDHILKIIQLQELISSKHSSVLNKGILRFGSAQKFFNLALKFYWAFNEIDEPPHLPIDRIVAQSVGAYNYNWTQSDCKNEYLTVIKRCKIVSDYYNCSLARWELHYWNLVAASASIGTPLTDIEDPKR